MTLAGALCNFPLADILQIIGKRTGVLRLYDVPVQGPVDIYLRDGGVSCLQAGPRRLLAPEEIVSCLAVILESGSGFFQFVRDAECSRSRSSPLTIDYLVMQLAVTIDERKEAVPQEFSYSLAKELPKVWLDPRLEQFFKDSQRFLARGVTAEDLSKCLDVEHRLVKKRLDYLFQLGFVRRSGEEPSAPKPAAPSEASPASELSRFTQLVNW